MAIDREKIQLAAQKHVEKRRFDKAIEEYQRIVAEDPNAPPVVLTVKDPPFHRSMSPPLAPPLIELTANAAVGLKAITDSRSS